VYAPRGLGDGIGFGTLLGRSVHVFATTTGSRQDGIAGRFTRA
jgi:hypothetical protein